MPNQIDGPIANGLLPVAFSGSYAAGIPPDGGVFLFDGSRPELALTMPSAEFGAPVAEDDALPAVVNPGPLKRFEALKAIDTFPGWVFDQLSDGKSMQEMCREIGLPRGAFVRWYMEEHAGLYDAALKVRSDSLAHEALEKADAADPETVGVAKLQVDTRLKVASKWDRERYGENTSGVQVNIGEFSSMPTENLVQRLQVMLSRKPAA